MMPTIDDIRRRNLALLIAEAGGHAKFAERAGMSDAQLSQLVNGSKQPKSGKPRGMRVQTAERLAIAGGKPAGWLDNLAGEELSPTPAGRGVAQDMSQYRITVAPQPIAWEQLTMMKDQLPDTFTLVLPDDALTPRLRRGDQVELNLRLTAEPGDLVLVRDSAGQHYVREYRRHRPDDWTAASLNGAYTSLVASQDQLEIIAVVEWERRGRHRD